MKKAIEHFLKKVTKGPWTRDQYSHIYGAYVEMTKEECKAEDLPDGMTASRQTHIGSVQGKDASPHDASLISHSWAMFMLICNLLESIEAAFPDLVDDPDSIQHEWAKSLRSMIKEITLLNANAAASVKPPSRSPRSGYSGAGSGQSLGWPAMSANQT